MSEPFTPSMLERLGLAVHQLPALQRTVYLMSARDDLAYPEIARRLAIPIDEVISNLAEALSALYEVVYGDEEDGIS